MSNPFESGPGDRPLNIHGDDRSGSASDHAVLFDPATNTGSPAAQAFIRAIQKRVDREILDVVQATEAAIVPLVKRIAALEKALTIEAERNADLLEQVSREFLDDGDGDGQRGEMQRLNDMAAKHHAAMEARNAG